MMTFHRKENRARLPGGTIAPLVCGVSCPECGGADSDVKDSRGTERGAEIIIRRRRICLGCAAKFTTFEISSAMMERIEAKANVSEATAIKKMIEKLRDELERVT